MNKATLAAWLTHPENANSPLPDVLREMLLLPQAGFLALLLLVALFGGLAYWHLDRARKMDAYGAPVDSVAFGVVASSAAMAVICGIGAFVAGHFALYAFVTPKLYLLQQLGAF